jgi:hypothetical protein
MPLPLRKSKGIQTRIVHRIDKGVIAHLSAKCLKEPRTKTSHRTIGNIQQNAKGVG